MTHCHIGVKKGGGWINSHLLIKDYSDIFEICIHINPLRYICIYVYRVKIFVY